MCVCVCVVFFGFFGKLDRCRHDSEVTGDSISILNHEEIHRNRQYGRLYKQ